MANAPLTPLDKALSEFKGFSLPEVATPQTERRPSGTGGASKVPSDLMPAFEEASIAHGVPINILLALAEQESSFNPRAVGETTKWGTAKGLMQYLDTTAGNLGINPYDPRQSIDGAARQLSERLSKGYSMDEAVMEHFAGTDRRQWGPKTKRYGIEVLDKAERWGQQYQAITAAQPQQALPAQPEQDLMGVAAQDQLTAAQDSFRNTQQAPSPLTIDNQQRFNAQPTPSAPSPLTPTNQVRVEAGFAPRPDMPADGFLSATGKSLQNIPRNFQNASGGLTRFLGEGMSADKERSLGLAAERMGISAEDAKLVYWAETNGLIDPELKQGNTQSMVETLRQRYAPADDPEATAQAAQRAFESGGLFSPEALAATGRQISKDAKDAMIDINPDGPMAKYGSMIIGSTAEMVPALLAGMLTRNPNVTLGMIGGQVYGQSYDRAREAGDEALPPREAAAYALAQAAAEAIPSAIPVGIILSQGKNFFKGLLKAGAAEAMQEGVTAALQAGIDKGTIDPKMTWDQARQQIIDGMIVGAGSGVAMKAGVDGANKAVYEARGGKLGELGREMSGAVDGAEFATTPEQQAIQALDPNNPQQGVQVDQAQAAPDVVIPINPMVNEEEPVEPAGPLARALSRDVPAQIEQNALAEMDTSGNSLIEQAPEGFAGQVGAQLTLEIPGEGPVAVTVQGYAGGDVILATPDGVSLQLTPEDLQSVMPQAQEVVQETAPQAEPQAEPVRDERTYDQMDEPELRSRLKYLGDQAKQSGWNKPLSAERRKVEKAIEAKKAAAPKAVKYLGEIVRQSNTAKADVIRAARAAIMNPDASEAERKAIMSQVGASEANSASELDAALNKWWGSHSADRSAHKAKGQAEAAAFDDQAREQAVEDTISVALQASAEMDAQRAKPADQMAVKDAAPVAPELEAQSPAIDPEPVKWFGTQEKADNFIAKKKMAGTHEVVQEGKRFEIREKAAVNPEIATEPTTKDSLAVGQAVTLGKGQMKGTVKSVDDQFVKVDFGDRTEKMALDTFNRRLEAAKTAAPSVAEPQTQKVDSQQAIDAPAAVEAATNALPDDVRVLSHVERAEQIMGAKIGDTVTLSKAYDYASADTPYVVESIDKKGNTYLRNTTNGGGTSISPRQAKSRGITFTKRDAPGADVAAPDQSATMAKNATVQAPPARRPQPGEEGYTRVDALNDLMEARAKVDGQGAVANDRDVQRVRQLEKLVKDIEAEAKKSDAPGTRYNTQADRNAADRLERVVAEVRDNRLTPAETGAIQSIESVIAELRKPKTVSSVQGMLNSAAPRLNNSYSAQADVIYDVAEQLGMPSETAEAKPAVSENKIFTEDAAAKARAILKSKLTQLNSGIDPEIMQAGITLAGYHIEKGARSFSAYAKAMMGDLGSAVRPYLKSWYMGVKYDPRASDFDGISSAAEVESFDVGTLSDEATNESEQLGQRGEGALAGVSAESREGTESQEQAGRRTAPGSRADARGNERAGSQRDDDARSMGSDAGAVPVSETGSRGTRRTERDQQPIQRGNERDAARGTDGRRADDLKSASGTTAQQAPANFTIAEPIAQGGAKTKYKANIAAIRLLKQLEAEGRQATRDEQSTLAQYVGWGGIPQAFERSDGGASQGWTKEVAELKELLTAEEYSTAASSTKNAHYTSPEIVSAMWRAVDRIGFKGGRVLEPSVGAGNFFGLMPHELRRASALNGVELDRITSGIAAQLYPEAKVARMGFQDYLIPDGHFDIAIGNPPFGRESLYDGKRKDLSGFSIHNYFFAKSLDGLKPGGVLAMVVTNRMLDVAGDKARRYMADRADFIGAIRLPNDAFMANAGTSVTTDIIFMRKRAEGEAPSGSKWMEVRDYTDKDGNTAPLNEYFHANPQMMLGDFGAYGSMYREGEPALVAREGQDTAAELERAIASLPEGVMQAVTVKPETSATVRAENVRVGSMFLDGNAVKVRGEDVLGENTAEAVTFPNEKAKERVIGMIGLRDDLVRVRTLQLNPNASDKQIANARKALNTGYDKFVAKHGPINLDANKRLFRDDPTWPQLSALEDNFDRGISAAVAKKTGEEPRSPSASKSAIFRTRTQAPYQAPQSASSAKDALVNSLAETGRVDMGMMQRLYGKTEDAIVKELGELIFSDPVKGYVTADEYLSGNVKAKLAQARAAAQNDPAMSRNVDALEAVQPADVEPVDINVKPGATWIPKEVMTEFGKTIAESDRGSALYNPGNAKWSFVNLNPSQSASQRFGTGRVTVQAVLEAAANQKTMQVFDAHSDGTRTLNETETQLANEKVNAVKEQWGRWIWEDDARRESMARLYNDIFNTDVPRNYDGAHLTLPGKVGDDIVAMRPHQNNAIWRIVQADTTLTDHVVGAGKAQPLDAKILTPGGWKLMGDIQPGDMVIAADGKPTLVEAVFPQGEKEIFKVVFSDGTSTECCDEHLWFTHAYRERSYAQRAAKLGKDWPSASGNVRSLAEIRETLEAPHLGAKNHSIPMVKPVEFDSREVTVDPYLLGVLLGDGHLGENCVRFTKADREIVQSIGLPEGMHVREQSEGNTTTWHLIGATPGANPLLNMLRSLGLTGKLAADKFIPGDYLFNDTAVRLAVLRGLMDTDGSVSPKGTAVTYCTASSSLADGVEFLVQSLGGVVKRTIKNPKYTYKGEVRSGQPCHVLAVCMPAGINPFFMGRKANAVVAKSKYQPTRYIVAVESVGMKPAQCIRVAHNDHLYVTDSFIVTHNTYTLIAGAMELRRMGLAKKPMFAVPNHLVGQWAADFLKLYPNANVLAATKKDFQKENRKRLFARIATGDWDAVIVAHSSFGKVEVEPKAQAEFIEEQIADLDASIEMMREADGKNSRNVKDTQKRRDALREKLKKLTDSEAKDDSLYWGELGVDALFVDEAHEFKNLAFSTSMNRVAGLGNQTGSQKAMDMFMKVQQVLKATGGRNVVFATGTPISNTMAEMYTMQRYLDYSAMKQQGISHFDAWARMYGEVVTDWELSPSGTYKMNSRFAKFVNMPELMQRYTSFADVINRDDINRMLAGQGKKLPVPKVKGGKPNNTIVERSPDQAAYIGVPTTDENGNEEYPRGSLVWRSENLPKKAEKGADNMLKIMGDARKAALDMRLIDPSYPDFAGSKVNQAARDIKALYKQWDADRGVQLVFIDLSTPKNAKAGEAARLRDLVTRTEQGDEAAAAELDKVSPDELMALDSDFSVYDDLKQKLIADGIPEAEVAFIHDAKTELQKEEMFGKVRSGRIRVLLGSTAKMGAGMNVQDRLVALHHLDAPWRPSDLEQREGRIIRQGNKLYERDPEGFEVVINRYATKQTLDSRMWQTIEGKAKFIEQVRKGNGSREVEDVAGEAANSAEMKAASSGNPLILEEMSLRQSVRKLETERSGHDREQHRLKASINQMQDRADWARVTLDELRKDIKRAQPADFAMTIDGATYDKRKDAGEALLAKAAQMEASKTEEAEVGNYGDFSIKLERVASERFVMTLEGSGTYDTELKIGDDPVGVSMRLTNKVKDLAGQIEVAEQRIAKAKAEIPKLQKQVQEWSKDDELTKAKAEYNNVIEQLKPKRTEVQTAPEVKASVAEDMERAMAMTEDEYIAAVNPEGKKIDADDRMRLSYGDLEAPANARPVETFKDKKGRDVIVLQDADGIMYAQVEGKTAGMMGPYEDGETVIDLVEQAKNSGIGTGLVKAYLRQNPLAPSGGFSPAGEATRRAAFRALKAERSSNTGITVDALQGVLRGGQLGSVLGRMIDNGSLVLHATTPAGINPDFQGWTDRAGKMHLVASKLTQANAMPVLLHEAFHSGGRALLKNERWKNLMARLNGYHKALEAGRMTGEWADAFRRVQNAKAAGDTMSRIRSIEELGAYAVENYERAPAGIKKWVEGILGAVKEFLYRRFGIQAGQVTPAQLRAMAAAALRSGSTSKGGTPVSSIDDVSASVPDAPSDAQVEGWFSRKLTDAMSGPKSKGQYSLLALAPMNSMVREMGKGNMPAQEYMRLKRAMDAYRTEKHTQFDATAQKWLKLNLFDRESAQKLAGIMHDATIAQTDPAEAFKSSITKIDNQIMATMPDSEDGMTAFAKKAADEKRRETHKKLRAEFLALPAKYQEQYREVRDTYKQMSEELDQIIMDNLAAAIDIHGQKAERVYYKELAEIRDDGLTGAEKEAAEGNALRKYNTAMTKQKWNKKARMTQLRQQFESNRLDGPYFPLARFGDYFVTVRDKDTGEVISFSTFENRADQLTFAAEVKGMGKVQTGLLSNDQAVKGAVDPRFVSDIETILGGAEVPDSVKDQVWQRYLESMPDMSMRKGFIHRKNREGFSKDALRAFASRMFHGAHQMGRLKFGARMQESLEQAQEVARKTKTPERDTAIVNEMNLRHQYVMNPQGAAWAQHLTSAAFLYQLSMSPAAAMVNVSQTVMLGVPMLGARHGVVKSSAALLKAMKDFTAGRGRADRAKSLNQDERNAMRDAYNAGLIESTNSHNLAGVGETGVEYSAVRNKVMGVMAWMFHQAERFNREVTFLAAYRLEKEKTNDREVALAEAMERTYDIHFDYGNTNRPRAMHGNFAKVALVFRNYQINMLYRLFRDTHQAFGGETKAERREAIHQLAGITGLMSLSAGVKGVWGYGLAMALASIFFGDDAEEEFKKGAIELLGPTAAAFLLNGVPGHALDINLSSRIGMPDLWFRSPDRQLEGQDEFNYWQSQLLGFLPAMAGNMFRGYTQIQDGQVYRGIETASPKFIKDMMRAGRFAQEGVTNMRGDALVSELKPGELIAQMMGFTPAVVSEQYERNSALMNAQNRILDDRRRLMDRYAVAHKQGDTEETQKIREDIKAFNQENREIRITPDSIRQSLRKRKDYTSRTEGGVTLNPKLDRRLRDNLGDAIYQ